MPTALVDPRLGIPAAAVIVEDIVSARTRVRTSATKWARYTGRPADFIREQLGGHLWSKQQEIAEAVAIHRRVAVHSAHETGKSWLAARLCAYWLAVHPVGEAFVVSTAPTATQVRSILWREIGRAYRQGNLPGRINQTEWFMVESGERYSAPRTDVEELVAFGRKPGDYDPSAFQGIHARHVLVVIDEAAGVPESIFTAAGSLAANEHARILAIGNPDDPQSHFAEVCQPDSGWHVIHVDGMHSPNFTDELIPDGLRDLLISRVYADELRAEVGEESPIYISKVLGRFPENTSNGVVPLSFVRRCQDSEHVWPESDEVVLGVDVGAGGDETVIRERRGVHAARTWRYLTPAWTDAVGHVMEAIRETGASRVNVDVNGIGWGVVGRLKELRQDGAHQAEIFGVNVGEASTNPKRFPKLRDQLWWEVGRELSQQQAWDLSAVDERTVSQLIAPLYALDSSGRIQVERKAETRKRLKRSPDDADALLLTFYAGGSAAAGISEDRADPWEGRARAGMWR